MSEQMDGDERLIFAGTPRGGLWRGAGASDDGSTVDIKDDRHTVVIGLPKDRARLLVAEHNAALAAAEAALTASREREAALGAYAMALRGDLVEIDDVGDCGDFDIYRHMHGTLEEDVAARAESRAEAARLTRELADMKEYARAMAVGGDDAVEERDTAREQLAELRMAVFKGVPMSDGSVVFICRVCGHGLHTTKCVVSGVQVPDDIAASTSETKPARVGDQPDETETNRPPQRETETSTAASGAQAEGEGS